MKTNLTLEKKWLCITCILLFFFLFYFNSVMAQSSKPNVIFILGDDIGYSILSVNGGQSYSTPRLDSMARHGMNFTRCEATPLCSTSRCAFLTGKYNYRNYSNWAYMNPTDKTIANLMRDAGYVTGIFGKHQLEYSVDTMKNWGWDRHVIFELTENPMKYSRYKNPVLMDNGTILQGGATKNKYGDDILTQKIFDFINANKSKPFFVYYSMSIGHAPYCPTPDDAAFANWDPDKQVSDTTYWSSMMHYMDKKVGQILDSLHKWGLDKNTLVIYAGDNGTPPEIYYNADGMQHIKGEKGLPREGGTHVPLIAYWPGHVPNGAVNNDLIDFTDFFPTFAQIANVINLKPYGTLDGKGFYDAILGHSHTGKPQLFNMFDSHPGFSDYDRWVRDTTYKLYDSTDERKPNLFCNFVKDEAEVHPITFKQITPAEITILQNFRYILDTTGNWPQKPFLNNVSATSITDSSAILHGKIITTGTTALIDRGTTICDDSQEAPYLQIGRQHDSLVQTGDFSMKRSGLFPQSKYRYTAYAMNRNAAHSTGFAEDSFYTLSTAPLLQPTSFKATAGSTSINLTWAKAKFPLAGASYAGYLLIYDADTVRLGAYPNGKPPSAFIQQGTIVPLISSAVPKAPGTAVTVSNLAPSTTYHFILIPYTWNGLLTATCDYLTDGARTLTVKTSSSFAINKKMNNHFYQVNKLAEKNYVSTNIINAAK